MIELSVSTHLSYCLVQKLFAVGLLRRLIKYMVSGSELAS